MEELDGAGNDLGGSEPFRFGAGDKQPQNFTWYEQVRFVFGLIGYGAFDVDPMFATPSLRMAFRLVRPIIDTNRKKINGGRKGGRPSKKP